MKITVTRNFDFDKLAKSNALSLWLNQYGNRINQSIQDGLNKATDITGKKFKPGSDFTHKSTHDGHAHKRPLVRSGRLQKSIRKLPATTKKLTFIIKSKVSSKARWNVEVDGKKSSGTRTVRGVNYGYMLNEGFKTSSKSLIPNKKVPFRNWFGIPSKFLVGGSEWHKMVALAKQLFNKSMKTRMKEYK
tara:strand:- start:1579 stop:2145 length:567 start_codon:yes stop_codon:yes gene_type:complete